MSEVHPLEAVLARLVEASDRQTAALERLAAALEGSPTPLPAPANPVLVALRGRFGREVFTSAEALAASAKAAAEAETAGLRLPELPRALAPYETPHALGRFLASLEGRGVNKAGSERSGTLWQITADLKPHETAENIPATQRQW